MPTPTYLPLATLTLGSASASVTFSSIPATFRDLIIISKGSGNLTASFFFCDFNLDTTAVYSRVEMGGNSAGSAFSFAAGNLIPITFNTGQSSNILQVMDYSANDKHKTVLYRNNLGGTEVLAAAGRYAKNDVINSVRLRGNASAVFASGSTFSLYGIA